MVQSALSRIHHPGCEARDRYRWLLLTGLFVLSSTVLALVVAAPPGVQTATEIMIGVAALALIVYNMAIKRWAVGIGLLLTLVAVMGWIVSR